MEKPPYVCTHYLHILIFLSHQIQDVLSNGPIVLACVLIPPIPMDQTRGASLSNGCHQPIHLPF